MCQSDPVKKFWILSVEVFGLVQDIFWRAAPFLVQIHQLNLANDWIVSSLDSISEITSCQIIFVFFLEKHPENERTQAPDMRIIEKALRFVCFIQAKKDRDQ